jgi:hypothetical protein
MTFRQNTSQSFFDQDQWQDILIQENTPEEKLQMAWRNTADQQTINQEVYDRKAMPHTFAKNQWVLENNYDFLPKNTKLAAKYNGPYQIVRVLPHNDVEIKISAARKSILHVNLQGVM